MKAQAAHFGYHLDELWIGDMGKEAQGLNRILTARGIHGIIVNSFQEHFNMPELDWSRLTAVCFDSSPKNCPMHTVGHSHFRGMRMAIRECMKLGYRRIGLATSNPDHNIQRDQWLASYLFEVNQHKSLKKLAVYEGEKVDPRICEQTWGYRPTTDTKILKKNSFIRWVEETKPDVILSYEKELELWLEETGYRIPEDLGFALIDYSQDYGDISGVDQQVEEIGKATVNTLVAHVEQNVMGIPACPTFVRLGGVWHDGGTLLKVST